MAGERICWVKGCEGLIPQRFTFCPYHQQRIFEASKSSNSLPEIYDKLPEPEIIAYENFLTRLMEADHASREAFGESFLKPPT